MKGKALKGKALKGKALKGKALKGKALKGKALKGKALKGKALISDLEDRTKKISFQGNEINCNSTVVSQLLAACQFFLCVLSFFLRG